ncbi:hypothetical protein G6011_273 [Alternaria panax]|uniref:FAD-binding domain-containing protein n=1 Tax=Alternaria panax TaxID=48097 RepID=A0AAD4IHY0_9PLEO|nr:hypothetical protein G6011_273 [Alternaria panax]
MTVFDKAFDNSNGSSDHEATEKAEKEVDLLIVGAGPTGLFSALLARQLGLDVCILDAKSGPLQVGGADAITARSQQYLEVASNFASNVNKDAGILGELLNNGVKCNTSSIYADGEFTSRQSHWWNGIPHTFYNNLLMIGQPFIERHLVSYLDVPVNYSEPALSFSHSIAPLGVTVQTPKRTIKAKYCLASDGARSFMRGELGIGWEGDKPNMVWAVLDCWIDTTFPIGKEIVTLQSDGESRMAWIPRERGMQRFYVLLDGEVTLEKTQASVRRHMAPHVVDFTHIEWFSKFEIKERVASSFLHPTPQGPFILAGDAAHVHSVNGGQGMNTGLSDAFSLVWRLYFSIKYPGLPLDTQNAIVESYDLERRATAKGVVDVAAKLVRSTTTEAKHYVDLIEKNSGFITGMGVAYSEMGSPLVKESARGIFEAGKRCPDLWLQEPGSGHSIRLYQKLRYGRYTLLLAGKAASAELREGSPEFLSIIRLKPLRAMGVGLDSVEGNVDEQLDALNALSCSWIKKEDNFAVLVRPDCYTEIAADVESVAEI